MLLLSMLAGCVATDRGQSSRAMAELQDTEVVVVSQPGFRILANATLAWGSDVKVYSAPAIPHEVSIIQELARRLDLALAGHGFELVKDNAVFLVYATVTIGDVGRDGALMGVLEQRTANDPRGGATVAMVLRRPGSERNLWQAVIRFEPGDIGESEQLLARITAAANVLLQRLPAH